MIIRMRMLIRHPWIIPTIIFSLLMIAGALTHSLWGDEADTALFARNILKFGIPTAWDGTNLIIANLVLDKDLVNHVHPWLPYYLVSLFFRFFGESSFIARLPFLLFSLATMPLFYMFSLKISKHRQSAFFATLALALSVPFILYAYQARYYAMTTFTGLVIAYCSLRLSEKKMWPKAGFIIGSILCFYGNYAVFIPFWASLFVASVVYFAFERKDKGFMMTFIMKYIGLSMIIAVFTAPWFFFMKPYEGRVSFPERSVTTISIYIKTYLNMISVYSRNGAFPLTFFFLGMYVIALRFFTRRSFSDLVFLATLAFFDLFLMSFLEGILRVDVPLTTDRYTMVVFPFLILASTLLIFGLSVYGRKVVGVVFFLFIFTNLLSLERPKSFLLAYIGEVTHPYPTPDKVVAEYLLAHAKKGETIVSSRGGNSQMVLLFYLKDHLRFVGSVRPDDPRFRNLPSYVYNVPQAPDWIVKYGRFESFGRVFAEMSDYEEIALPVYYSDLSRPEIDLHAFGKPSFDANTQVFLYRKKSRVL